MTTNSLSLSLSIVDVQTGSGPHVRVSGVGLCVFGDSYESEEAPAHGVRVCAAAQRARRHGTHLL